MRKPWDRQMLYDMLRDTPAFQAIREEGREEGREALRQALLAIVQARFPSTRMVRLAKGQAAIIDDPAILQDLIVKVSLAQSAEEAQRYLLDWPSPDNEQN
jgi:hypothetical protein